jgi:hypothetical protein
MKHISKPTEEPLKSDARLALTNPRTNDKPAQVSATFPPALRNHVRLQSPKRAPHPPQDAADFFFNLAAQQTVPSNTDQSISRVPCIRHDIQDKERAEFGAANSQVISLDLPKSHSRVLDELHSEIGDICQTIPAMDRDVIDSSFHSTRKLDCAIRELALRSQSNPDEMALLKAYAAMALLKQTALCVIHYGLSCAYMVSLAETLMIVAVDRACTCSDAGIPGAVPGAPYKSCSRSYSHLRQKSEDARIAL